MSKIADFLSSVKLTITLLVLLAATSVIGTIIPQGESFNLYVQLYGQGTARLLNRLYLTDMYRAPWCVFFLALLGTNLLVCSLKRFPKTWAMVTSLPAMTPRSFANMPFRMQNSIGHLPADYESRVERFLSQKLGKPQVARFENGFLFFAQKGRWTRLGVYVVHFSVLLLFGGAIVGVHFGFKGMVNIREGETVNEIFIQGKPDPLKLHFGLRCDRFTVKFYPNGAPEEFRSDLTFIKNGQEALRYPLRVNDPVTFDGITFYQSTYGTTIAGNVTFELAERETGKQHLVTGNVDQDFELPRGEGRFRIVDSQQNLMGFGPAVKIHLLGQLKEHNPFWILERHPEFDKRRQGTYVFRLMSYQEKYYTGLQANRDPGVWLVYSGFLFILLGLIVAFFMSHRILWVQVRKIGDTWQLVVAGLTNKNRAAYKQAFGAWCGQLKELQR
jgi:cytochrome c biogenesis protein